MTRLTQQGDFCGYDLERRDPTPFCFNVWTRTLTIHDELKGYFPSR